MTTPHKHAELIKQWADGNEVQWRLRDGGINPTEWINVNESGFPGWDCGTIVFRVKPEPKPDVVLYAYIGLMGPNNASINPVNADDRKVKSDTCMFIFDGETRELKDAQVLAQAKPVNLLVGSPSPMTVADIAAIRRWCRLSQTRG